MSVIDNPVSGGFTAHGVSGKLRQGFALSPAGIWLEYKVPLVAGLIILETSECLTLLLSDSVEVWLSGIIEIGLRRLEQRAGLSIVILLWRRIGQRKVRNHKASRGEYFNAQIARTDWAGGSRTIFCTC